MKNNRKPRLMAESLEPRRMFAVADFLLADVNTTSARYDDSVSPRDYMGQVSGWYFGHST
ncbi:MAG: hypothetical protein AAF497_28150 [Planctomycetota bacterium]